MSKPKKVSTDYISEQVEKARAVQQEKDKAKRKTKMKIAALCCAGAVVIGAASYAVFKIYRSTGAHLRGIAVESDHYKITNAMMNYCIDDAYQDYLESVKGNTSAERPIKGKSFKKQNYGEGQTWFEYLTTVSCYTLEKTLKMCEAAYDAGYTLTDEAAAECQAEADALDMSKFSDGVQVSDAAEIIRLKRLAKDYEQYATEHIEVSSDELNSYFDAHSTDYAQWEMLCFSVSWADGDANSTEPTLTYDAAQKEIESLKNAKTPDAFRGEMRRILTDVRKKDSATVDAMVKAADMHMTGANALVEIADWVAAGAKVNETYAIESESDKYTQVYMLTSLPVTDKGKTVDLRMIQLSAGDDKKTARELADLIFDDWKSQGGTEAKFAELAKRNTVAYNQMANGGLCIGFSENTTDYGTQLRDWAMDTNRKAGDTETFETDNAVILAYYIGMNDLPADKAAAYQTLYNNKLSAVKAAGEFFDVFTHPEVYNKISY